MFLYIGVFFVLLLISAFASSSEVAFFSLSKSETEEFKGDNSPAAKKIIEMIAKHKQLIATILIVNNFVNIFAILTGTYVIKTLSDYFQLKTWQAEVLDISTLAFLLLFMGEIMPKVYANRYRLVLVRQFYGVLYALMRLFGPLIRLMTYSTQFIDKRFKPKNENASYDDILDAIQLMPETDKEESDQRDLMKRVLNLQNNTVESVIRDRTKVVGVEYDMQFEELVAFIREHEFSRLPVYEETLDNIKGILHIKDLLPLLPKEAQPTQWQQLIRPAMFVPESKKIDRLLEEFKQKRTHLAIVVDEFGGTTGIVTLDDITEEIFGDITDEYEQEDATHERLDADKYRFLANPHLNDVAKILDVEEELFDELREQEHINSLAGLILFINEKIPEVNEQLSWSKDDISLLITIETVSQNKIESVLVEVKRD